MRQERRRRELLVVKNIYERRDDQTDNIWSIKSVTAAHAPLSSTLGNFDPRKRKPTYSERLATFDGMHVAS